MGTPIKGPKMEGYGSFFPSQESGGGISYMGVFCRWPGPVADPGGGTVYFADGPAGPSVMGLIYDYK